MPGYEIDEPGTDDPALSADVQVRHVSFPTCGIEPPGYPLDYHSLKVGIRCKKAP